MTPESKEVLEAVIRAVEKACWQEIVPDHEERERNHPGAMKSLYSDFDLNSFIQALKDELK